MNNLSLEALIITHASKTLPEFGRKDVLKYPGAPGVKLLGQVVENIRDSSGIAKISVVFDHKVDCDLSSQYLCNLTAYCEQEGIALFVSPSALSMPSQLTATNAFCMAVKKCKSDYLLLWEHDHLFTEKINPVIIENSLSAGFKMIRFNRSQNLSRPSCVPEIVTAIEGVQGFCRTNFYCNGPFIAKRDWCEELFEVARRSIPTWNGCFGGFIEGPVNRIMIEDQLNLDETIFASKYPICLYGGIGYHPVVKHFGDFPGRRSRMFSALKARLDRLARVVP